MISQQLTYSSYNKYMNLTESHGPTDQSQSFLAQKKYRKALKQINKLIAINTSIKKQLITVQAQYDNLLKNYGILQQKYHTLQQNIQYKHPQDYPLIKKVTTSYQCSQQFNEANNFVNNQSFTIKINQIQNSQSMKTKDIQNKKAYNEQNFTKYKLQQIQQKLSQKEKQIEKLKLQLTEKDRSKVELQDKYIQLRNSFSKTQKQFQTKNQCEIDILEKEKKALQIQLFKQKQLVQKLMIQSQKIKNNQAKKLFNSQQFQNSKIFQVKPAFKDSKNMSQGIRPTAVPYHQSYYSSAQQSLQGSIDNIEKGDQFIQYYFKKVRELQDENSKLKKQNKQKKSKYKTLINQLREQIVKKDTQFKQLNQFIAKQQQFIETFCNEKNLNLTNSNKTNILPHANSVTQTKKNIQNKQINTQKDIKIIYRAQTNQSLDQKIRTNQYNCKILNKQKRPLQNLIYKN